MSKKTLYLLGILLTIIIGTFLQWKFCCKACNAEKIEKPAVVIPKPKEVQLAPFGIKEVNDNLLVKMQEQFSFSKSNFIVTEDTLPKDVNDGVLKIKEYLDENGEKHFNIVGYYTSDEVNDSAYPNLGLARASAVKKYMVSKGVSAKLINTFGELNDKLKADANNIIYNTIDFSIIDKDELASKTEEEALIKACELLKEDPLVLNFQTNQAAIVLSSEQRTKFARISKCVDKLGAKVKVVGHTDNTGNPDNNVILGQERAEFAKKYLVKNGILSGNVIATSKGQTEPIATNATAEGRAKNRRTVVTIE